MNTYLVYYQLPIGVGLAQAIQAANIHTAVNKVLFQITAGGKPVAIRKGQSMTIRVTRIS